MEKEEKAVSVLGDGEEIITTQTELMQKNVGTELVKKAVKGDEAAFEEIYRLTYRYVFAVARFYLKNDEDIYDAIQDTFARVYKHIGSLNDPESFAWWLRKIAENCAKTIVTRKETVSDELSRLEEQIISHDDPLKDNDVSLDITEVLESMEPADAELLAKKYYDKMTVAEIAQEKGLPHSTVRSRVKAAEKRLRSMLRIRGIDKPFYGGEFVAMITTAFRNAIGTDLLSATVAQEILDNVRGKDSKGGAVITAVAEKERNKAVLRLAGIMVAVAIFFALLIFLIISIFAKPGDGKTPGAENSDPNGGQALSDGPSKPDADSEQSFWDKLFGRDEDASAPSSSESAPQSSNQSSADSSSDVGLPTPGNTGGTASGNSSSDDSTVFVADCLPEQYNTLGRGADNGYIATQGDWLYTAIGHIAGFNNNGGLWKVKKDGSGRQKLTGTSASQINAVGEYLYFLDPNGKIMKIRTDGKEETRLSDLYAQNLTVVGNFAYFVSYGTKSYGSKLRYYKMDLTTLETEVLIDNLGVKEIYWSAADRLFIIDMGTNSITRFYPDTKTEELWYSNVDCRGVLTGRYFVSDKIYDLSTKRTPISNVAGDIVINTEQAYYYVEKGVEKLYINYMYDDMVSGIEYKMGILDLASMSFTEQTFGFDSELYVNGYSYSNIYDGYIYANNDEGYFMRTKIGGDGFLMYK